MTKIHDDPVRSVPRRVLSLSAVITVILVIISYLFRWPISHVLIGFWVGVIISLISFRLMEISARKLLDREAGVLSALAGGSFIGRLGLYAIGLFLMVQISFHAFLAAAGGLSMVGLVLRLRGLRGLFPLRGNADEVD